MIDLSGQTALIIGALDRLAAGAALSLSQAGASLVFGHDAAGPPPTADFWGQASPVEALAFGDPERLGLQFEALPQINTVVINPGWFTHAPFLEARPDQIERAIEQNFEQATLILQAAARKLIRSRVPGSIIVLSSVASLMPFIHTNLAGSTLAAFEVVARMAAVDLGQHGIRVNILAAGWLADERSQPLLADDGRLHTPGDIPLGAAGRPEDVGQACCFLASAISGYITGAVLPVDGGYLLTKSAAPGPYPA